MTASRYTVHVFSSKNNAQQRMLPKFKRRGATTRYYRIDDDVVRRDDDANLVVFTVNEFSSARQQACAEQVGRSRSIDEW